MTTALADRARHAGRSWRDTAELRVSPDPADAEELTPRNYGAAPGTGREKDGQSP